MSKKLAFQVLGHTGKLPSGRYWMEADGDLMISIEGKEEGWRWYYKCRWELDQNDLQAIYDIDQILDDEMQQMYDEAYKAGKVWIDKLNDQKRLTPLYKLAYQDFKDEGKKIQDPDIYDEQSTYMDYTIVKEDFIDIALDAAWCILEDIIDTD